MSQPDGGGNDKQRPTLRMAALNMLARRECSRGELQQKLTRIDPDSTAVTAVLDQLQQQGLQSDSRFAEAFLRSRHRKGQGPYRIRNDLKQCGVAESVITEAFAEQSIDWFDAARRTAVRRFGDLAARDFRERSKRARFLQYRGFESEQIRFALAENGEE